MAHKLRDYLDSTPWASAEQRDFLVTNEIPFFVDGVSFEPSGQYGPRWKLLCHSGDEEFPGAFYLSLTDTDSRRDLFETLRSKVSTLDPLGPVRLVEVRTKAGRTFRTLEDVE